MARISMGKWPGAPGFYYVTVPGKGKTKHASKASALIRYKAAIRVKAKHRERAKK